MIELDAGQVACIPGDVGDDETSRFEGYVGLVVAAQPTAVANPSVTPRSISGPVLASPAPHTSEAHTVLDLNFLIQSVIAMVLISSPPDPAKLLLFNSTIASQGRARTAAAVLVAGAVLAILVGSALFGGPLLNLLGINLDAFSFVGGLIIFAMGVEMLYGGAPSRAQGGEIEKRVQEEGADQEDEGLIIPLSIPLIAGPGAIVTAITISSRGQDIDGLIAAVAGAITVAAITFASMNWLGGWIAKLSRQATALLIRIGGLLLATIGAQMFLGGLKNFFGL